MNINYDVITFQKTFILRKHRVAHFADIIKIATMFIQTTFKGSKRLKKLKIMYENEIYIGIICYNKSC